MKATAPTAPATAAALDRSWAGVWSDLVKARLTLLVLLTTLAGFYMGASGPLDGWLLLHTLGGTGLLACGAAALNQLMERDYDARMRRTAGRPLPSGRLQPETVLWFGVVVSALGVTWLWKAVNPLTAWIGAVTVAIYLFIYTPLKRYTWLNTLVGAVPGALPPLMGWTAAREDLSVGGWGLFAILFFWQVPHFLAIAWLYREDYARAGFVMLPNVDATGVRTARQTAAHAVGLVGVSLWPALLGQAGLLYGVAATALGAAFVAVAWQFAGSMAAAQARRLFLASILYLPLLLSLLAWDKRGG